MKVILELMTHSGARIPECVAEFEALPALGARIDVTKFEPAGVGDARCNSPLIVCDVRFEYRPAFGGFLPIVYLDSFPGEKSLADEIGALAENSLEELEPLAALLELYRSQHPEPKQPK